VTPVGCNDSVGGGTVHQRLFPAKTGQLQCDQGYSEAGIRSVELCATKVSNDVVAYLVWHPDLGLGGQSWGIADRGQVLGVGSARRARTLWWYVDKLTAAGVPRVANCEHLDSDVAGGMGICER
jgi:hypothetical protein